MKRRWLVSGAIAAALVAAAACLLWPRGPEEFPLIELVPEDALLYAGFREIQELERWGERLPRAAADRLRAGLRENRSSLAGPVAIYLDRRGEWVALARLTRLSSAIAGAEVEGDAAVVAATPEALARHRARRGSLARDDRFRALRSRLFVNLDALALPGRLRDFSAAGLAPDPSDPLVLRGRALYRPGVYRLYLEHYVQAPLHGAPQGPAPAAAVFTDPFPRLWEDLLLSLTRADRERLERHASRLSRDFLEGRSFRRFLEKIGPWGARIVPAAGGIPSLVVWVDLPDAATRDALGRMLHRTADEVRAFAREGGTQPLYEVSVDQGLWRVRIPGPVPLRLGDAFAPAYVFRENRLVFSTRASALEDLPAAPGGAHVSLSIDVPAALGAARSLAGFLAELAFLDGAGRAAARDFERLWTRDAVEARRRQLLTAHDRAGAEHELDLFLADERSRFVAAELGRISKTPRCEEERARLLRAVDAAAEALSWLGAVSLEGSYRGEGFDFTIRSTPR